MKIKILLIIPALLFLSGCATYSVKKGEAAPYNKGFVVTRYDRLIPEYTLGQDNSVPTDEQLARERFRRRRLEVENYYKKMGYIENRFKQNFIDPPVFMAQTALGIFWLPSIAIKDYKYNHDQQYKESVDKQEDAEYKAEKQRIKALKDQLNAYIQEDLKKEPAGIPTGQKTQAPAIVTEKVTPPEVKEPVKAEPKVEAPPVQAPQTPLKEPTAVIVVKPQKGPSPLFVQFNAAKSSSPNGRIVAYAWDFGDGDASTQKNPRNTYWSTTYGSRKFTATLTVKDQKGISASTSAEIEVITK